MAGFKLPKLPDPTKSLYGVKGDVSSAINGAGNSMADVLIAPIKSAEKMFGGDDVSAEGMSFPELPPLPNLGELPGFGGNDNGNATPNEDSVSSNLTYQKRDTYAMTD